MKPHYARIQPESLSIYYPAIYLFCSVTESLFLSLDHLVFLFLLQKISIEFNNVKFRMLQE